MAGFQMAMQSGPLCEEPVQGILVVLECVKIKRQNAGGRTSFWNLLRPLDATCASHGGSFCFLDTSVLKDILDKTEGENHSKIFFQQ
jgi:hypothetical protein